MTKRQAVFLLAALCFAPDASASTHYAIRMWGLTDGLPTSSVQDIAQTPDGYLWLSTTGGLARFDGVRFEVFGLQQGLPSNRIQGLATAKNGHLFASCEDGSLLEWDGRSFRAQPTQENYAAHTLLALRDGSLLASTNHQLWRRQGGRIRVLQRFYNWLSFPVEDAQGRVWLTTADSMPARLAGDRIVALGPSGTRRDRWIRDLRDGSVCWRRTVGRDAVLLDTALRPRVRLSGAATESDYLIDRQGQLWGIAGPDLVIRDARDGGIRDRIPLGISGEVQHVFMDRDENLWIGTRARGLIRVAPSPLQLYTPPGDALPQPFFAAYMLHDGGILAADDLAHLWRVEADGLRLYRPVGAAAAFAGSGRTLFRSLEDPTGDVRKRRIDLRDSTGRERIIPFATERLLNAIEDPHTPGTIYVNAEYALFRLSAVPGVPAITNLIPDGELVRDARFDSRDRLWVATTSGLWRYAPGDTERFTRRDGLPTDHVRQILPDHGDTLWIGTYGGGLVRYAGGRFQTIDHRQGLFEDVVSIVLEDDDGNLWLGGNAGIQRVAKAQVNDVLAGRRDHVVAIHYGREAGLRNPEGTGYPGLRSRDGRLWFPTMDGLAVVDPKLARPLVGSPPAPLVEAVLTGTRALQAGGDGFRLAPNERRFTIRYTGIDLRSPEQVRFRYRLEGLDRDWIDAGGARQATYTNVPPGRYVFRVAAISGNGLESRAPAAATLVLSPYVWETWWFRLLAVVAGMVAVIAATALGWRNRSRLLLERAAELQRAVEARTAELVDEKARTETALSTVEAQAQKLAALDRARSRFFASISHELRTPLTLIQGPLQDVRDGSHGELRADAREQVGIALDSASRLHRLVDQLLDAARAEAGELRLEPRPGDLVPFLESLCLSFAPLAERKRITFRRALPGAPAPAAFDPLALEKVFANLLGNAFKFTPEGGHVALSAARSPGEPATLEVRVTDDGPGISAEDLPHVFKRFYRAERSITRVQPGTGLGLALAQDMVEQHDGVIAVESLEGHGCTFTVRLPLLAADALAQVADLAPGLDAATLAELADEIRIAPEPPAPAPLPDGEDAPTVLVVDDHPEVRAYVVRRLRPHYRVVEAADGAQALAHMHHEPPDLVVSDLSMPVMDGLALCHAIRRDPELDFIPVILLTAAAATESRISGIEGGADDYLTKPFEVRELLARIEQMLKSRRRLRERLMREAAAAVAYGTPAPASAPPVTPAPAPPAGARPSPADTALVRRLREVVESRMGDEGFDVEQFAEAMGMGRTLLFKQVGQLVGRTPRELIYEHRLERAASLLAAGEGGVGEVGYAVGFRSVAHFTNRFRARFGVTPSVWRRGERAPAASPGTPTH